MSSFPLLPVMLETPASQRMAPPVEGGRISRGARLTETARGGGLDREKKKGSCRLSTRNCPTKSLDLGWGAALLHMGAD
jgi:hypothetical protein